jgi:hypothetical protein
MHRRESCDEGRKSWASLQQRFEALKAVPYPPTPQ